MHDPSAEGGAFFKCDFCRRPWTDDRPMVEGHNGSLICAPCLTIAYTELCLHKVGDTPSEQELCTLCLEHRSDPHWRSPAFEEAIVCRRCVKQAAGALHKDPDFDWRKPVGSGEASGG